MSQTAFLKPALNSSTVIEAGSKEILVGMQKLGEITLSINTEMNEINTGVESLNSTMKGVISITAENEKSIDHVADEIGKFKVENDSKTAQVSTPDVATESLPTEDDFFNKID